MEQNTNLRSLESKMLNYLLATQDRSGGWAEHPGSVLSSLNTAEVVIALAVARPVSSTAVINESIAKAVAFLLKERESEQMPPPDSGLWYRKVHVHGKEHKAADIIRTSVVIMALITAGQSPTAPPVAEALGWLDARARNPMTPDGHIRGVL